MKNLLAILIFLGFAFSYAAEATTPEASKPSEQVTPVTPEKSPFTLTLKLKYGNKYMSKGYVCVDGDVLLPEVKLNYHNFYVGIWMIWDWNDKNRKKHVEQGNVEETDFYIGYDGLAFDNIMDVDLRWTYYDYPQRYGTGYDEYGIYRHVSDGSRSAIKADFTCTNEYVKDFKPGVEIIYYYNFHSSVGFRFHTGYDVNLSFISEKLTWTNLLEAWYGDQWYRGRVYHQSGLCSAQYTIGLNYAINEHITVGPYFELARLLKKSYSEYACQSEGNHEYNWRVGFIINTTF